MTSKYQDHLPLYRQAQSYAREGVQISESTLGDWVGAVHELVRPLTDALKRHVFVAEKIHTDDTPLAVLSPGTGTTRQARLWTDVRDDRPPCGATVPSAWCRSHPGQQGVHHQQPED